MEDNNKKEKIVAIILSILISIAVAVLACVFGIKPEAIREYIPFDEISCAYTEVI